MSYSDGKLIRYSGTSWVPSNDEDFFFKLYFDTPSIPINTVVNVDFLSGEFKGVLLNDDSELTTDTKFLLSVLVDDTASISWSDPVTLSYDLQSRLPDFLTNVLERTQTTNITGYTGKYKVSYVDFWIYTTTEINRSLGFTNSIENVQTYSSSLFQRGLNSSLLGSAPLIMNGLNEQSVIDAFFVDGDSTGNSERVGFLVSYLDEINCLRLEEVYDYWGSIDAAIRSEWADLYPSFPGTTPEQELLRDSIKLYDDVSEFVVSRWAKSFIPVAFIVSDGDNSSTENVNITVQSAQSSWNDQGSPVYTFGIGKSENENYLRTISSSTNGNHFLIESSTDWDLAETNLLHSGIYSLFTSYCNKSYEFEDFTWISEINAEFDPVSEDANNTFCSVEIRWSEDRVNFSEWKSVQSGTPFVLKKLILNLEYRLVLRDGWDGTDVIRPRIIVLTHTIVSPSIQYLFTPPQQINGMMFETLLSASSALPVTAVATWGISRGNSTDFADFAPVHLARKGALPNRQSGVMFTPEILFAKLPTKTDANATVYYVYTNSTLTTLKTWSSSDEITVYQRINLGLEIVVPSNLYVVDGDASTIIFDTSQAGTTISVTIRTPPSLFVSRGEKTTTLDYKTYYLTNGRWSPDNNVIVLVNNNIVRGGYWINPEDGSITFSKEKEVTDIVSVYVEFSDIYRVGVEVKNYDVSGNIEIKNFALYFNSLANVKLQAEVENTLAPFVTNASLLPKNYDSDGNLMNPTIYQRLTVDYLFNSINNASESGSTIRWWRYRSGQSLVGETTQVYLGQTYILLDEYNDRVTEKKSDVGTGVIFGSGDKIFVEITPSDGYTTGVKVATPLVILDSDKLPYVLSLNTPVYTNTSNPLISPPSDAYVWSVSGISTVSSYFEAGTYFVAYSFINGSGETITSKTKTVVLSTYQSIQISSITLPDNATAINYYCSIKPNSSLELTGTLSFNSSSTVVSGTGTVFTSEIKAGYLIYNNSNVFLGRVLNVTNNTTLNLTSNASATFSGSCKLIPIFLAETNTGGVETIISELKDTVYVFSPNMTKDATTGLTSCPTTDELTAIYTYRNPDNADNEPDESIVEWYLKDNTNSVVFTGKTVPADSTKAGEVYIFKVTPYNSVRFGVPVWSSTVLMK